MNRKTLHDDMQAIMAMHYDIVMQKSSPNKYFWGDRTFEIPELKLLIDAVSSSRFITSKKSKELISKLKLLCSEGQAEGLDRHVTAFGRVKADNKNIYYIVDSITDAINCNVKISFQYTDYNGRKEKILRNNGEVYILSPYNLYWNEDYYYVLGYSDKHENISAFRVDRLKNIEIMEEKRIPKPKDVNASDYSNKIFSMYAGDEVKVELQCQNSLMKYIVDRFGIEVDTTPIEGTDSDSPEGMFMAKVKVAPTPTFYSWVFQFGVKIKIVGPDIVVDEFKRMVKLQE